MFKNIFYFLQGDEWLSYCDEESKPKIEQLFDTLKDEIFFYTNYAISVEFSVCSSSVAKIMK